MPLTKSGGVALVYCLNGDCQTGVRAPGDNKSLACNFPGGIVDCNESVAGLKVTLYPFISDVNRRDEYVVRVIDTDGQTVAERKGQVTYETVGQPNEFELPQRIAQYWHSVGRSAQRWTCAKRITVAGSGGRGSIVLGATLVPG